MNSKKKIIIEEMIIKLTINRKNKNFRTYKAIKAIKKKNKINSFLALINSEVNLYQFLLKRNNKYNHPIDFHYNISQEIQFQPLNKIKKEYHC